MAFEGEEHRVAVRQVRHHFNDEIKALEKKHKISEDERHTELDISQKITDEHVKMIDDELKTKMNQTTNQLAPIGRRFPECYRDVWLDRITRQPIQRSSPPKTFERPTEPQ